MKAIRQRQGITAEQLANLMREAGVPFDKTVIANLETGRRRFVTVQELLALAEVLVVAPVHLLVPPDDEGDYQVTPAGPRYPLQNVRSWVRGKWPITRRQGMTKGETGRLFFLEAPVSELPSMFTRSVPADELPAPATEWEVGDRGER